ALASRLDAAVPEPFQVVAEQEEVWLLEKGRRNTGGIIVDLEVEEAVWRVLTDFQDELAEQLRVPWPHDPALGYVFHEPEVVVRDGAVHFWYGEEGNPVLAFEPIPLNELHA